MRLDVEKYNMTIAENTTKRDNAQRLVDLEKKKIFRIPFSITRYTNMVNGYNLDNAQLQITIDTIRKKGEAQVEQLHDFMNRKAIMDNVNAAKNREIRPLVG